MRVNRSNIADGALEPKRQDKILEEYDRMVSEFGLTVIDASRSIERQQREMRMLISQHLKRRRSKAH